MKLTFSPVRMDMPLVASVEGDVLTLNGAELDFAPLPPGAVLPRAAIACDWIAGDVSRDADGRLHVPLILPHGGSPGHATLFPADMVITQAGIVHLPDFDGPGALEAEEDRNDD